MLFGLIARRPVRLLLITIGLAIGTQAGQAAKAKKQLRKEIVFQAAVINLDSTPVRKAIGLRKRFDLKPDRNMHHH